MAPFAAPRPGGGIRPAQATAGTPEEVWTLDAMGHGSVLARRFRLEERTRADGVSASFRAVDQLSDEAVDVLVLPEGSAVADRVLAAARRAETVDDPRTAPVVAVGSERGVAFVVTERVVGSTLAELVAREPLPAVLVRELVGEAAQALEAARRRGLPHRAITPSTLLRTPDGGVRVLGLGTAAALAGLPDTDPATAARDDAHALVALLYAGLCGRWPHRAADGLAAAPLVAGRPVRPSEVVSGVPSDLDALCAAVLAGPPLGSAPPGAAAPGAPATAGDVAAALAPWGGAASAAPPGAASASSGARAAHPPVGHPAPHLHPASGHDEDDTVTATDTQRPRRRPQDTWAEAEALGVTAVAVPEEAPRRRPPNRLQSAAVLAGVALLVTAGLVLALQELQGLGEDTSAVVATGDAGADGTTPPPPALETPTPAPGAAPPPVPVSATALDPLGDDEENDALAPLAIDGDPATAWATSTYSAPNLGGLKAGVGLLLDLGAPAQVSGAALNIPGTGGTLEFRSAPNPELPGSVPHVTVPVEGAPVEVTLPEPVTTRYLILWFTRLPEVGGRFRGEIAQVQLR